MLPLIMTDDQVDLVCSQDPSVELEDRDPCRWLTTTEATAGPDALRVSVRPLNGAEVLRVTSQAAGGVVASVQTSNMMLDVVRLGSRRVSGPGLSADGADAWALLQRLPAEQLVSLGTRVLQLSEARPDPRFGGASA